MTDSGGDMVEFSAPSGGKKADTQARYRQRQKVTVTAATWQEVFAPTGAAASGRTACFRCC